MHRDHCLIRACSGLQPFDPGMSEAANNMRTDLMYTKAELRAFQMVHNSTAGKLRRRLARKTEKLQSVEVMLGNDPDKLEFMRKVNRELADAQRKLLNLQYQWTSMEAEVTELQWQETKGKEELAAVQKMTKMLDNELEERRVEQAETDAELAEGKQTLEDATREYNKLKGEALEGVGRDELKDMKAKLAAAKDIVAAKLAEKSA